MNGIGTTSVQRRKIGMIGTYLPRRCGIATFTTDLSEAIAGVLRDDAAVVAVALNDRSEGYAYPGRVKRQVCCETPGDYEAAAEYLNANCRVVCLQHEFGIFGGTCGENVLALVENLRVPLVVTCHTVLAHPEADHKRLFRSIVARADKLIVMNRVATPLLTGMYGAAPGQVAYIQHGIHDVPYADPPYRKKEFGLLGRVLLTFGLLHRNKGIEVAVEAMAEIVRAKSDTTYVIAGQTHPAIIRDEGESYRRELEGLVRDLGLENHVVFIDRFFDLPTLMTYLQETDIFLAPYLTLDHMTSGALAYAAGSGNAVVATPFLHARELLAENRGVLVPTADPSALADAVIGLLGDAGAMEAMRRRVYAHTRSMVWPAVAREYVDLFHTLEPFPQDKIYAPYRTVAPPATRRDVTPQS